VPDAALPEVVWDLAAAGPAPPGCVALHLSGALSTDVLAPLHGAGYALGSLHPLIAVADPWLAGDRLLGAAFALGGEPAAVAAARRIVAALGGRAARHFAPQAGRSTTLPPCWRPTHWSHWLPRPRACSRRPASPAMTRCRHCCPSCAARWTTSSSSARGAALTGPIARGDVDTVRLHLARLSPGDRVLYCGLGLELLRLAREAGLDDARAEEIESLLTG
jgi:predicted short-subunit dehydrogenase-like oxidoreductase (DUF2520 family)